MKSVIASFGIFAATANALSFPRHMAYRRDNGTDDSLTTLTVRTTQIETITSCAAKVTDCPVNDKTALDELPDSDKSVVVVTHTVDLTTTVCPVTEAEAIKSSVVEDAKTGGIVGTTLTAPATLTDDDSLPEQTSMTTIVSDAVTDKTVTLTLGTGNDATVVTTTVQSTIKTTITVPCSQDPKETDDGSKGNGSPDSEEPTTTTTMTTTNTITRTVHLPDETTEPSKGDDGKSTGSGDGDDSNTGKDNGSDKGTNKGDNGSSNGSGDDSCTCPEPVTVTVSAPASTVYVTVGSDGSKTKAPDASVTDTTNYGEDDDSSSNKGDEDKEVNKDDGSKDEDDKEDNKDDGSKDEDEEEDDEEEDDEEDGEDEYCDEEPTTTVEATVTVVPIPVNTTIPTPAPIYSNAGFARRLR